ncbi:hypothetical protein [Oceanithermus desulfurans]|uniref:Uncharacterized protein n=2 Tax=Oceanithermus desulfurans TaxID=227924 RepID=A0A511RJZ6_9DEIN|nr:hypothetical protein [Oceanithermus desulfurans]MBB6029373.1 hypothetical protein [Oceanithermus desulfurans]GEM89971.1 hypothetical protein ODE01S_14050 [Oceanithermus desulfurans NBRC 100063]
MGRYRYLASIAAKARALRPLAALAMLIALLAACHPGAPGPGPGQPGEPPAPSSPFSTPLPDTPGAQGVAQKVWCPDAQNSGRGFHRVSSLDDLPTDPVGDGENNCYMEAFDTSVFSTDGRPVSGCANLDLTKFSGHDCVEAADADALKQAVAQAKRRVIVVTHDLELGPKQAPTARRAQEDVWIIGRYDPSTRRPVLLRQPQETYTVYLWAPDVPVWRLTVINLRVHAQGVVFAPGRKQTRGTVTLQSITAKSTQRLIMYGFETPAHGPGGPDDPVSSYPDLTPWPIDDALYMRAVLARGGATHSVYVDRIHTSWAEDVILLPPFASGKHAAKFDSQNVVVYDSVFANTGLHNQPFDDPEWRDAWFYQGPVHGNNAGMSLASCSRVVLDHVTVYDHYKKSASNAHAIQWQPRTILGGACDMPMSYYPEDYPTSPYHGPAYYQGVLYPHSPFWDDAFWDAIDDTRLDDPGMIVSHVTNTAVHHTDDGLTNPANLFALGTTGTYPVTRKFQFAKLVIFPDEVPAKWKERQRVVVNHNCLDDGYEPDHEVHNYIPAGAEDPNDPSRHARDNTDKFVVVGPLGCAADGAVDDAVRERRNAFLASLEPPPWLGW